MIALQTDRVRGIVKGLLDYARQTRIEPAMIDLNDLLEEIAGLMENQALVKGVELITDLAEDLPKVVLDRSQMQSVLVNLVINALDATPQGGRITIKSHYSVDDGNRAGEIEVVVEDTGCGVPPGKSEKALRSLFHHQGSGAGDRTGIGGVGRHCDQAWRKHKGAQQIGRGECIHHPSSGVCRNGQAVIGMKAYRILIVEDDPAVLDACCRILRPEGVDARTAVNAGDAFDLIKEEPFDLVLTDLKMPGRDGLALAAAVRKIRPELPVLAMTGYMPDTTAEQVEKYVAGFIPKPFTPEELLSVIWRVLEQTGPRE